MATFDDSRLDDPVTLNAADAILRQLAMTGSRIRVEAGKLPAGLDTQFQPRGVLVVGAENRLIRAVLEPTCPVPLVAWPLDTLPAWVGPLDLVVALAGDDPNPGLLANVLEATRRGAQLIVAAAADSPAAAFSPARALLPTRTGDPLAVAVAVLEGLQRLGLGPIVYAESVAEAADVVAEECGPFRDLSCNPAKELALALAERQVLLTGTSVLASRAARRVAEALRHASGQAALAADAAELTPVVSATHSGDLFADPYEAQESLCPVLVVFDDQRPNLDATGTATFNAALPALIRLADARGVRVVTLSADADLGVMDRYVSLLQQGLYGAAYLSIGLDTPLTPQPDYWEPGR
ncbi:MAG: phosphoheptose isomerase [Propionibacteriaceae bacterium]|nr:phosphoheptose isomerase [Propionibacteriaceae bacterium]